VVVVYLAQGRFTAFERQRGVCGGRCLSSNSSNQQTGRTETFNQTGEGH
jgi:hypothetical protein